MPQRSKVILMPPRSGGFRADCAKQNNTIGKQIYAARKSAGLTQAELSRRLLDFGVSVQQAAITKWEAGETVPNSYQLLAICHALGIEEGIWYFMGSASPARETLNAEGLRLLNEYRAFLESKERYQRARKVKMVTMPTSTLPASAGLGDYLEGENFEMVEYPDSIVPAGSDFAVPIDGDSMEPAYHDGQNAWIQRCESLNDGEVGLFVLDGHGYIKLYSEDIPDEEELEEYTDSYGIVHPKVSLVSLNKAYSPISINPGMDLRVVGRVLN